MLMPHGKTSLQNSGHVSPRFGHVTRQTPNKTHVQAKKSQQFLFVNPFDGVYVESFIISFIWCEIGRNDQTLTGSIHTSWKTKKTKKMLFLLFIFQIRFEARFVQLQSLRHIHIFFFLIITPTGSSSPPLPPPSIINTRQGVPGGSQ